MSHQQLNSPNNIERSSMEPLTRIQKTIGHAGLETMCMAICEENSYFDLGTGRARRKQCLVR